MKSAVVLLVYLSSTMYSLDGDLHFAVRQFGGPKENEKLVEYGNIGLDIAQEIIGDLENKFNSNWIRIDKREDLYCIFTDMKVVQNSISSRVVFIKKENGKWIIRSRGGPVIIDRD